MGGNTDLSDMIDIQPISVKLIDHLCAYLEINKSLPPD